MSLCRSNVKFLEKGKNHRATFTPGSEASPCSSQGLCMNNDNIRVAMGYQHHFAKIY